MVRWRLPMLAFYLALLPTGCHPPAAEPDAVSNPDPFLADVESRVVTSATTGREYQVSVALPLGYADSISKVYPVLIATDANGHFGTVVEAARMLRIGGSQIPQLLIVGMGYPTGGRQALVRGYRKYDLSPVPDESWDQANPGGGESGGGPQFLRFLRDELIPLIEADYRADPADRAIYGHSMGGLFAFYSLLEGEGTFQRAIAASPSLWWSDHYIFGLEQTFSEAHSALAARLFLSMGLEEPNDRRYGSACCESITNLRRLGEILERRRYEGLEFQYHLFEGENHQSVVSAGISKGLRFIYDPPG